ncbi:MAG: hypothetical protein ACK5UY_01205 [Holosporales bacterium]
MLIVLFLLLTNIAYAGEKSVQGTSINPDSGISRSTESISSEDEGGVNRGALQDEKVDPKDWKRYLAMVERRRLVLQTDVINNGVEESFIAKLELKRKPWFSLFVWESTIFIYPKELFDRKCMFQVFIDKNNFVWGESGPYGTSNIPGHYVNRQVFQYIFTESVDKFNFEKRQQNSKEITLLLKGLSECIDSVSHVKIETRVSK